jgi:hypothetical protein
MVREDSTAVTVAHFGDLSWHGDGTPLEERRKPYGERPRVDLEVSLEEDLNSVLRRAADQLGVTYSGAFFGFYTPRDDESHEDWHWYAALPLVDGHGHVYWRFPAMTTIAYRELLRSADEGALAGDPRRPYLVLTGAIGDGILPDWGTLVHVFHLLIQFLTYAAATEGTLQATERVKRLLHRTREADNAISEASPGWADRGGDPYVFSEWLDDRPWLPEDIAPLLDCSARQAEMVLWAFGFAKTHEGLWRRAADNEAALMYANLRLILNTAVHAPSDQEMAEPLRALFEAYIESGSAPSLDLTKIDWLTGGTGTPRVPEESWVDRVRRILRRFKRESS